MLTGYELARSLLKAKFAASGKDWYIAGVGFLRAWGTTVPADASAGYAKGCIFFHTDGETDDALVYVNTGSGTSAAFKKLSDIATAGTDFLAAGLVSALTSQVGAAAAAVALRLGKTATEGLEIKVIDELVTLTNAVEVNLTQTVPAGAVILSAQGNLNTAVTGDGTGDNLLAKVGIGVTGDPDKYGKSADLNKNTKIDFIPDWAVLSAEETVCVKAAKADGSACTEKFDADGIVRVRIVYAACNSLDDVA